MATKYASGVIPATVAGTTQQLAITSEGDENKSRHLTGVFVSGMVTGNFYQIIRGGTVVCEIDGAAFSAAAGFMPVDLTYDPQNPVTVGNRNSTGANTAAVNTSYRYEIPGP